MRKTERRAAGREVQLNLMWHQPIRHRWSGTVICAAPGPSLPTLADFCNGVPVVAVGDAWREVPWAELTFATDAQWWDVHAGIPDFRGERWSTHNESPSLLDDKRDVNTRFDLDLVEAEPGEGFRLDGRAIHYGDNSGFAAINLCLALGAKTVILVGFDMRTVDGTTHFFGSHPPELREHGNYERFIPHFERAAKLIRPRDGIEVLNATPGSALTCFPAIDLKEHCKVWS